ncbi:MAG: choice-of-anchor J domain-containing protein [Muribaculaceae bacterium]
MNADQAVERQLVVKKQEIKVVSSKRLANGVMLQLVENENGLLTKRLITNRSKSINPKLTKRLKAESTSSAIAIKEGFEGYDGTEGWQPEGWSTESKGTPIESDNTETWFVSDQLAYSPEPIDNYYEAIYFSESEKDEWLCLPEVTLTEHPMLYFYAFVEPLFLFNLNNVDWDTFEFTTKECAANLQVLVKGEGDADWTVVMDYYEEYKDYSLSELFSIDTEYLEKESIDLAAWAGKKAKIAFRYVGTDGNTMMLDNIIVSEPSLEASYSYPLGTLFYGLDKDFGTLSLSMPVLPVGEELVWYNTSEDYDVDCEWQYHDWATNDILTTNTTDLTAVYHPDYTNEFTCRNNCYDTPILTISKTGAAPGEYSRYEYFQAGGRAEWSISDELYQYHLIPFDINTEGFNIAGVDNDMDAAIPIYGYSKDVDAFWTNYTFQGQEEEGEGVKMTGIFNYHFTMAQPIVINNAMVWGKGQIGENAVFTIDIIPLSDEGEMLDPIATAKCKGSEMIMMEGGSQNYYSIPFTFSQPVVLSQDVCSSYIVRLSGFNDPENVTYFAPYQSVIDNPDGYALGWIEKVISMGGETRTSLSPVAYYSGYQSFAIGLDAEYPWLDADAKEVIIGAEGKAEVALGSYYDGSVLTATQADGSALPAWLSATISGRYNEAKVEFTATNNEADVCEVKIAGPGVSQTIKVNSGSSSLNDIIRDENQVVNIYNVSGQQVKGNLNSGIYIMRHADGTVSKKIVK